MYTTKVIDHLSVNEFKAKLKANSLKISSHAFDYISSSQREIYSEDYLIKIATENNPQEIGVQRNGHLRVTYRRDDGIFELIFSEKYNRLEIITFIKLKSTRKSEDE